MPILTGQEYPLFANRKDKSLDLFQILSMDLLE